MAWKQARERNLRLQKKCKSPDRPFTRGVFFDTDKKRPVRKTVSSRAVVWKKIGNRKVRRAWREYARGIGHAERRVNTDHNGYRRIFDYDNAMW